MLHVGGKNAKKKTSSSDSKRHFTVVMGNKEHGLYVSSSPSSAARKAVSKLCATDKKRKVQFSIREITQGSKKKTYGPYLGEIEKLKEPIELKGRVIRYKPVAKLDKKTGKKIKGGMMRGGEYEQIASISFNIPDNKWNFTNNVEDIYEKIDELRRMDRIIFYINDGFHSGDNGGNNNKSIYINFNNFSEIQKNNEHYKLELTKLIELLKYFNNIKKNSVLSKDIKFKFDLWNANDQFSPEYNEFLKNLRSELEKNNS